MAQIKSQLDRIAEREKANQQEQAAVNQRIAALEEEIKQLHLRRSQLDREALQLYAQVEELQPKYEKLQRIANLSQEFLELHQECQDNQDLLNTLYYSISNVAGSKVTQSTVKTEAQPTPKAEENNPKDREDASNYRLTINDIKKALPNAEKLYQNLVANYLEEYKTHQNYILDGLDLIWYAVAFIAFGRSSYRKMSFKYHPDIKAGSERAMQLINTAWEISQHYLTNAENDNQESENL
jgi:chromosome segregation ATPase